MTKHLLIRDVRLRKGGFQLGVNGVQGGGGGGLRLTTINCK